MALPGHRRTSSDRKRRAAHFALKKKSLSVCSNCKQPILAHRACANCGTYNGRVVIDITRQTKRILSRTQTKIKPVVTEKKKEKKEKSEKKAVSKESGKNTPKK